VIDASAHLDGVFFERPQTGRRLARVEDPRLRAFHGPDKAVRHGGDPRKPLEEIQGRPLSLEQGDGIALDPGQNVAGFKTPAVLDFDLEGDLGIDLGEDEPGQPDPGQDAFLLGQEHGLRVGIGRNDAFGSDVPLGDILLDGGIDDAVDRFLIHEPIIGVRPPPVKPARWGQTYNRAIFARL